MQPGLATDVLLLAVADRANESTAGHVGVVLAGALLCAEVQAGTHLQLPFQGLTDDKHGRQRRKDVVGLVRARATTALDEVAGPLCRAGILAPAEHRVLGLFPRRGFRVVDGAARWQAEQRLRAALVPGSRPDPGTAALAVLCAVSGIARSLVPPPKRRQDRTVLAEHLNGLEAVVGPAVAEVLVATRRAYRRSSDGSDAFVPVAAWGGGSDGYGDSGGDGGGGGGDGGGGGGGD